MCAWTSHYFLKKYFLMLCLKEPTLLVDSNELRSYLIQKNMVWIGAWEPGGQKGQIWIHVLSVLFGISWNLFVIWISRFYEDTIKSRNWRYFWTRKPKRTEVFQENIQTISKTLNRVWKRIHSIRLSWIIFFILLLNF